MRPLLRCALTCLVLASTLVLLHRVGSHGLAAPPLFPRSWPDWIAQVGPALAVASCVRLLAIAFGWYLLAGACLVAVTAGSNIRAPVSAALPRILRRVLGGAVAASVAVSGVAMAAGSPGTHRSSGATGGADWSGPGDRPLGADGPGADAPVGTAPSPTPGADATPPVVDPHPTPTARLERFEFEPAPIPTPEPVNPGIWTARCGDHLWAIAEEVLVESGREDPRVAEVERYWRELVRHNTDRLIDPSNPDFILPGQEFELPSVTEESGPERVSGR